MISVLLFLNLNVVKSANLDILENFTIDCQPFDKRKWEQGGSSPVYFNFKSKNKVIIYSYYHSMFLSPSNPDKIISKKEGKYRLSLDELRIFENGSLYNINRSNLVMKDKNNIGNYNCEIFETFLDTETLMKIRVNLYIQEIKNKNKF